MLRLLRRVRLPLQLHLLSLDCAAAAASCAVFAVRRIDKGALQHPPISGSMSACRGGSW